MRDYKHKRLQASLEVLKQEKQARVVGRVLSFTGGLIGLFCVIFATHVALG